MRTHSLSFSLVLLASSLVFACGGSDGTTPIPSADTTEDPKTGGTTTSGSNDPEQPTKPAPNDPGQPTQPGSCNSLVNDAEVISSIAVVAIDAPAPTGGTFPDGTFHLHGITLYAGKSGKATSIPITIQGTVKVAGDKVEQVLDGKRPDGTILAERSTDTIATNGSQVTFTKTCDGNDTSSGTFSANSSELTLFLVNDVGQTVAYKYR